MAKSLGKILRELRLEAGMSLRTLSKLTGFAPGYLSLIETGARKDPGFTTVLKIARSLRVSMEDIAAHLEGSGGAPRPGDTRSLTKLIVEVEKANAEMRKATSRLDGVSKGLGEEIKSPSKSTTKKRSRA